MYQGLNEQEAVGDTITDTRAFYRQSLATVLSGLTGQTAV